MRHHRHPFIWPRRATIRVRWGDHRKGTTLGHRRQLRLQKFGLRSTLIGMGHGVLGRQIPAINSTIHKIDTRRQDQFIIGHRSATSQGNGFGIAVHANGPIMHHVDTRRGQSAIAVAQIINLFEATQIQVREETSVIHARGFNQRNVDFAFAVFGDIAGSGGPPCPAANHHNPRFGMAIGKHRWRT